MDEKQIAREVGSPTDAGSPLLVSHLFAECAWWYLAPLKEGESLDGGLSRCFWVLMHDVLPSFGMPKDVTFYGETGRIPLAQLSGSHAERIRLLEKSIPPTTFNEISVDLDVLLRTPSGHFATSGTIASLELDANADDHGIDVRLTIRGSTFSPPDSGSTAEEIRQYEYNAKKLPIFLRSLQFALDTTFLDRTSNDMGPDGYLEPGPDQSGLQ